MSEVREGYKMTELGEIPVDWDVVVLGDYLIKHEEKSEFTNQYPVLTSSRRGLFLQNEYYTRNVASEDNTGYNVVPRGYFTYRHMSDDLIFKFNINDRVDKGIVSTLYPVFTTKGLDDYFLKIKLNEGFEFRNFAIKQKQGGTRTYIYFSKLEKLKIILPPLKEQQKIASILSTVDEQINETEQLIVKTKELKKGLMQQLLTKGIGHTEFKQTELGEIPISWECKKFEEVMVLQRGFDLPIQNRKEGDIPILSANGISGYHSEAKVNGPGIITGRSGTIGKVHYIEQNFWALNTSLYVKEMFNNYPKFLFYFLSDFGLEKYSTGTGVPTLNRNDVHKVIVAIPSSFEEQQKIASILSTVDEQINVYEQEKAKYEELKKGLMQKLLTGQIRVKC